jgi:hypothetical protein
MKWIYVVKFPKSAGEKSWMNEKAVLLTVKAIIVFFYAKIFFMHARSWEICGNVKDCYDTLNFKLCYAFFILY